MDQPIRARAAWASKVAGTSRMAGRPDPALVPVLGADDEITPEVDGVLAMVALAARNGDRTARNLLYVAFEAKILRFARRYGRGDWPAGRTWDVEDVAQEAFLVFVELVEEWPGGDSFAPYFLARFPWRLRDAVVRRLARPLAPVMVARGERRLSLVADGSAAGDEALVLLEVMADSLPPTERAILLWQIRDGERPGRIAKRLGMSRRSVHRSWQAVLAKLRPSFGIGTGEN